MNSSCERVDTDLIGKLARQLPDDGAIVRISNIFHALRSSTRLEIMFLLLQKDMCVCELEYALGKNQSTISHALRTLRQLDLVRTKKEGRYVVYFVADEHVSNLMQLCREHVEGCN